MYSWIISFLCCIQRCWRERVRECLTIPFSLQSVFVHMLISTPFHQWHGLSTRYNTHNSQSFSLSLWRALFSVHGGNLSLVNFFDTNFYVCEGFEYKVQFWTVFLDTHAHTLHLPLTLYPPWVQMALIDFTLSNARRFNRHHIISTTACKQAWLKK